MLYVYSKGSYCYYTIIMGMAELLTLDLDVSFSSGKKTSASSPKVTRPTSSSSSRLANSWLANCFT
jgi:hypothetical protein